MIEKVELVNFISHKDTSIQLENGVNVFIGANGAGKSSVIDAITYGLYGEHTRDTAKNFLRRGAAGGSVSVTFSVAARQYLAERKFGQAGKFEAGTLRELAPNPRLIVAGERRQFEESMSREISKTFGLDYERMKVAAIVQQGELDAIIKKKPKELKELLNSLIGIDKLDIAFGNMRAALDGFRLNLRTWCMNFDDQSIGALTEEILATDERQKESAKQAGQLSARLSELDLEQRTLESEIAVMEPLRAKNKESIERKEDLVRYVRKLVTELGSEEEKLTQVIDKAKEYLPFLASKPLIESESGAIEEEEQQLGQDRPEVAAALRSAKTAADRAKALEGEILEGLDTIKQLNEKAKRRQVEIARLKSVQLPCKETAAHLRLSLADAESSVQGLRDEVTKVGEVIGRYKEIQSSGVCQTCGSTVAEINLDAKLAAKHREHSEANSKFKAASSQMKSMKELLDKRKEYDLAQKSLKEQIELLTDYNKGVGSEKKKIALRRKEAGIKSAEARNEPMLRKKAALLELRVSKLREKRRSFGDKHSTLIKAEGWLGEHEIASNEDVTKQEQKLAALQQTLRSIPKDPAHSETEYLAIDEFSLQLADKVMSLEREASKFDQTAYDDAKKHLEDEIKPKVKELTGKVGGWRQSGDEAAERLSKLNEAKTRIVEATSYIRLFEKIRTDVYNRDGILAKSLRSWALKELSRSASDYMRSFGIGLSELQLKEEKHDVNIECYSASGMADVKSMSGGESVAIALALRFAMARLMGKGMVDFIALDEPTTHLDEERRRSLVRLVTEFNSDEKRSSLSQILVITHDREIFEDSEVNAVFQFQKNEGITTVTKS